jgi:hypothetical protein
MAGGLLFVTQALLDSWAGQGKIDFVGNVMTLQQGEGKGRSYALEPAVRFLKVIGADQDPHKLLAKVKQVSQLREMGAEQVENSVIMGDCGYEVEPGFLAEASAVQAASAAAQGDPPRGRPQSPPEGAPAQAVRPVPSPPEDRPPSAAAKPAAPAHGRLGNQPVPLPRELEEKRKEAEALARFLLENLS